MAKRRVSLSYKKAEIDNDEYLLIEEMKDEVHVHDLKELADKLSSVEGVSIRISYDEEIEPQNTEY